MHLWHPRANVLRDYMNVFFIIIIIIINGTVYL